MKIGIENIVNVKIMKIANEKPLQGVGLEVLPIHQSPSAARGLRYRKWPFAKEQCFGGFGGVSPPL